MADEVTALLREHGLELELCAFYDPIGEMLHGVGFDGSPARFFRSIETDRLRVGSAEEAPASMVSRPS
ncbi:MAG: hypothetical protein JRM86_05590 [Nitrososphaerota archaeon]|nr:hypothetical protein [Nitrososphaerota archaeon]